MTKGTKQNYQLFARVPQNSFSEKFLKILSHLFACDTHGAFGPTSVN